MHHDITNLDVRVRRWIGEALAVALLENFLPFHGVIFGQLGTFEHDGMVVIEARAVAGEIVGAGPNELLVGHHELVVHQAGAVMRQRQDALLLHLFELIGNIIGAGSIISRDDDAHLDAPVVRGQQGLSKFRQVQVEHAHIQRFAGGVDEGHDSLLHAGRRADEKIDGLVAEFALEHGLRVKRVHVELKGNGEGRQRPEQRDGKAGHFFPESKHVSIVAEDYRKETRFLRELFRAQNVATKRPCHAYESAAFGTQPRPTNVMDVSLRRGAIRVVDTFNAVES